VKLSRGHILKLGRQHCEVRLAGQYVGSDVSPEEEQGDRLADVQFYGGLELEQLPHAGRGAADQMQLAPKRPGKLAASVVVHIGQAGHEGPQGEGRAEGRGALDKLPALLRALFASKFDHHAERWPLSWRSSSRGGRA
jgi:hypothetical protein